MRWLDPYTRRTLAKRFCPSCGYDVADLVSRGTDKCPECGGPLAKSLLVADPSERVPPPRSGLLLLTPAILAWVAHAAIVLSGITEPHALTWYFSLAGGSYAVLVVTGRSSGWFVVVTAAIPAAFVGVINYVVFGLMCGLSYALGLR